MRDKASLNSSTGVEGKDATFEDERETRETSLGFGEDFEGLERLERRGGGVGEREGEREEDEEREGERRREWRAREWREREPRERDCLE